MVRAFAGDSTMTSLCPPPAAFVPEVLPSVVAVDLRPAIQGAVFEAEEDGNDDLWPGCFLHRPPRAARPFKRKDLFAPETPPPVANPLASAFIATPGLLRVVCPRTGAGQGRKEGPRKCPSAPLLWPVNEDTVLHRCACGCCPARLEPSEDDADPPSLRCGRAHSGGQGGREAPTAAISGLPTGVGLTEQATGLR
jgi:hypothetical protein